MQSSEFLPDNQPLDDDLVATITALSDGASIDNVLWGDCLVTIFGIPSILDVGDTKLMLTGLIFRFQDVSFVVSDDRVANGYSIFMKMGFRECKMYTGCRTLFTPDCASSPVYARSYRWGSLHRTLQAVSDALEHSKPQFWSHRSECQTRYHFRKRLHSSKAQTGPRSRCFPTNISSCAHHFGTSPHRGFDSSNCPGF